MQITRRLQALRGSPTTQVMQLANELKRKGVKVYDFGVGEPDFPTPEPIKDAARQAMAKNLTKYTSSRGVVELRQAVADRYNRAYGTTYGPQNVVICAGAKQALYNLALALVEPGDEVLIPAPYWVTYPALVQLAGGTSVFVEVDEASGFQLKPRDVEKGLTPKTRLILLNSPCNPTGAVIAQEDLKEITALAAKRHIPLIYDECYECFVYGQKHGNPLQWDRHNVIAVGSASKTYAMTGWRIGWAIGPVDVMDAIDRLQSQSTSNPTSIAQWAVVEALRGDQSPVEIMRREYERRLKLVLQSLGQIQGLTCPRPQGAFYVFPNVSAFFSDEVPDSAALAKYLLENAHVAVVPGSGFGAEGYIRISYAAPEDVLQEGLTRMGQALEKLLEPSKALRK